VYIYYLGTPPAPQNIKLYQPFNNRECLHCHLGARSFEEGVVHTADPATLRATQSVPSIPRGAEGPVFREPWEAQAATSKEGKCLKSPRFGPAAARANRPRGSGDQLVRFGRQRRGAGVVAP